MQAVELAPLALLVLELVLLTPPVLDLLVLGFVRQLELVGLHLQGPELRVSHGNLNSSAASREWHNSFVYSVFYTREVGPLRIVARSCSLDKKVAQNPKSC